MGLVRPRHCVAIAAALMLAGVPQAQTISTDREALRAETLADHRDMLAQLGIKELRPGPSGDESAPNHANYDEAKANPYPNLPEALVLKDGTKVTTAAMWWEARRPEIVEDFEREVVGRVPQDVPDVDWTVTETREWQVGEHRVIGRQLVGRVDHSAYPAISVNICMTLVTPADSEGRVPVMIMFGSGALPQAANAAPQDQPAHAVPDARECRPTGFFGRRVPPRTGDTESADPPATGQLIAGGWGYASLSPSSIQADNGAGLTRGIVGLVNHGERRKPDDWGALRAWAWGASRALDYLETQWYSPLPVRFS